eukprot:365531-Chlamydomonas_euryale.AAC.6
MVIGSVAASVAASDAHWHAHLKRPAAAEADTAQDMVLHGHAVTCFAPGAADNIAWQKEEPFISPPPGKCCSRRSRQSAALHGREASACFLCDTHTYLECVAVHASDDVVVRHRASRNRGRHHGPLPQACACCRARQAYRLRTAWRLSRPAGTRCRVPPAAACRQLSPATARVLIFARAGDASAGRCGGRAERAERSSAAVARRGAPRGGPDPSSPPSPIQPTRARKGGCCDPARALELRWLRVSPSPFRDGLTSSSTPQTPGHRP